MGVPGWPDSAAWTASIDNVRTVLMQRRSRSFAGIARRCGVDLNVRGEISSNAAPDEKRLPCPTGIVSRTAMSEHLPSSGSASTTYDAVVVGGGFYGARLALLLRRRGERVLLVEREATLLARASIRNQARVHNGYHYPRSVLTSMRSRVNYRRF